MPLRARVTVPVTQVGSASKDVAFTLVALLALLALLAFAFAFALATPLEMSPSAFGEGVRKVQVLASRVVIEAHDIAEVQVICLAVATRGEAAVAAV